jgi:hypothetical protein
MDPSRRRMSSATVNRRYGDPVTSRWFATRGSSRPSSTQKVSPLSSTVGHRIFCREVSGVAAAPYLPVVVQDDRNKLLARRVARLNIGIDMSRPNGLGLEDWPVRAPPCCRMHLSPGLVAVRSMSGAAGYDGARTQGANRRNHARRGPPHLSAAPSPAPRPATPGRLLRRPTYWPPGLRDPCAACASC